MLSDHGFVDPWESVWRSERPLERWAGKAPENCQQSLKGSNSCDRLRIWLHSAHVPRTWSETEFKVNGHRQEGSQVGDEDAVKAGSTSKEKRLSMHWDYKNGVLRAKSHLPKAPTCERANIRLYPELTLERVPCSSKGTTQSSVPRSEHQSSYSCSPRTPGYILS